MNSSDASAMLVRVGEPGLARMRRIFKSSASAAPASSEHQSISDNVPARPRVMLADDEPFHHFVVEALLCRKRIELMHAADGAEAVSLACSRHFDLILMDMQMPVLDGLRAAALIRRHEHEHGRPSARIVAYTSSALANDLEKLRAFGIDGSLAKPCTSASLESCLARWCTDGSRPKPPVQP